MNLITQLPTDASTTARDSLHMPVAVYLLIMLIALALGADAVYVNREYAYANLAMLGLDDASLAVRRNSIDLLLLADIALFFVAALMPRAKFGYLRGKLLALGLLIWAFNCAHTYQARFGIVMAGQSTATAVSQHASDLRASIDSIRATATGLRQSAARQATSVLGASRADGSASLRQAMTADQRADELAAQLAQVEQGKAPAESAIWGQWTPWKMFAESLLISMVGLVMFSLAGEMLCTARDAHAARRRANPAPKFSTAVSTWSGSMPKPSPAYAAIVMPLGAITSPMPVYAPPISTPPTISVPSVLAGESKQAQSQPVHPLVKPAEKKARSATVKQNGFEKDTAITGRAEARYLRIRSAVMAGSLKPSVRSIQAEEGGGTLVARRYLQQLAAERVIERVGQGWARAVPTIESQLQLVGV